MDRPSRASSRTVADREGAGDQASSYPVSQHCVIPCSMDDSYIFESIDGVRWRGPWIRNCVHAVEVGNGNARFGNW